MDEFRPKLAGMVGRHLDVIADHVIVADLQCRDRGLGGVARLQGGDGAPTLVAQPAPFVELVRIAGGDKAAVAGEQWQFISERPAKPFDQNAMLAESETRGG